MLLCVIITQGRGLFFSVLLLCVIIGYKPGESGRVRTVQHEQTATEMEGGGIELPTMVTVHHVTESPHHASSTGPFLDIVPSWNQYRSSPLLGSVPPQDDSTSPQDTGRLDTSIV